MNPTENPPLNTATAQTPPKTPSTLKQIVKEIVIFAVIAVCIVLPFRMYIAEPYVVDGASMDPTFHTGDYLVVNKLSYKLGSPKRNTVLVFRYPNDPRKSFIKRVIGLPNETVIISGEKVTIINTENPNGFEIDQSYVTHQGTPANLMYKLSESQYFVMGDNRAESFDSRSWGPLGEKFILGEPILQLWPLSKISIMPGADTVADTK